MLDTRDQLWVAAAGESPTGPTIRQLDLREPPPASDAAVHWTSSQILNRAVARGYYELSGLVELAGEVWSYGRESPSGRGFLKVLAATGVGSPKHANDVLKSRTSVEMLPPIDELVIDARQNRFVVLSGDQILEASGSLNRWKEIGNLAAYHHRSNASWLHVNARQMHVVADHVIVATTREGYVDVRDGVTVPHTISNQLRMRLRSVTIWRNKLLAWSWPRDGAGLRGYGLVEDSPMLCDRSGWQLAAPLLDPPDDVPPGSSPPVVWESARYMAAGDSLLVAAKSSQSSPTDSGHMVVGVRSDAGFTVLANEATKISPAATFLFPDGQVAALDDNFRLVVLSHGLWTASGSSNLSTRLSGSLLPFGSGWIVRTPQELAFLEMQQGKPVRLQPLSFPETLSSPDLFDAVASDPTHILVALTLGVFLFDLQAGSLKPVLLAGPASHVWSLSRGSTGKIWMAGDGLWIFDAGHVRRYDGPPYLADADVQEIKAIGDHGFVLALGDRGLAIVNETNRP